MKENCFIFLAATAGPFLSLLIEQFSANFFNYLFREKHIIESKQKKKRAVKVGTLSISHETIRFFAP